MEQRNLLRGCLTPGVIVGAVVFALVLFGAVLLLLFTTRGNPAAVIPATPVITIIPAPTATPIPVTAPPPTVAPTEAQIPPSPPPGAIKVGSYVQINGTGGDGLRVRSDPALNAKTLFVALEAEVFQVSDGPREADGYTWWYLTAPYDTTLKGWAVSNYLSIAQKP